MPRNLQRIAAAKAFVAEVRARTRCAIDGCDRGPIEWHNPQHLETPVRRISNMARAGYSVEAVAAEIARCTPFCRRHHLLEDGRMANLELGRGPGRVLPVKICRKCGRKARPSRRGLCNACYLRDWRRGTLPERGAA